MYLPLPRDPRYGWIPDLPDQRDYRYAELAAVIPTLPPEVDLRSGCTPVENQGKIGSCTACALVGDLEYVKKQKQKAAVNFSKLFLYYNERVVRHTQDRDSGASLRDGIKTLVKIGDCLETLWPYVPSKLAVQPPESCYQNALGYQITNYYRLHALSEMKHTLSTGFPFVFGFAVYESFESSAVAHTGVVSMPAAEERLIGGHAVAAVGYIDAKKYLIVRNSWGAQWGDHGYFYMPYAYLTNASLSSDFWTIRDME